MDKFKNEVSQEKFSKEVGPQSFQFKNDSDPPSGIRKGGNSHWRRDTNSTKGTSSANLIRKSRTPKRFKTSIPIKAVSVVVSGTTHLISRQQDEETDSEQTQSPFNVSINSTKKAKQFINKNKDSLLGKKTNREKPGNNSPSKFTTESNQLAADEKFSSPKAENKSTPSFQEPQKGFQNGFQKEKGGQFVTGEAKEAGEIVESKDSFRFGPSESSKAVELPTEPMTQGAVSSNTRGSFQLFKGLGGGSTAGGSAMSGGASAGSAGGSAAAANPYVAAGGAIAVFVIGILLILGLVIGGLISQQSRQGTGALTGNVATAYSRLMQKIPGAKPQGVAGILGNYQIESGLDPSDVQGGGAFDITVAMNPGNNGYALGVGQWDGSRRVSLLGYALTQSKKWNDLNLQLDFAINQDGTDSEQLKQIAQEGDVAKAAADFDALVERSSGAARQERIDAAQQIYAQIMSPSAIANTSGGVSLNDIPSGWKVDDPQPNINFTGDEYPWGQCTWWAWGRANQLSIHFDNTMGNGGDWWHKTGYTVTQTPTRHAAISFSPGEAGASAQYGHVAFVEDVKSDGSILISESNYGLNGSGLGKIHYRTFTSDEARQFHYVIGK